MADRTEYVDPGDVAAQTIRTLQNVEGVLAAGGARFDDVMMLRVYLTKREDFPMMNEVYGEFISARVNSGMLPARTTVFTGLPREEMLVEIDALALTETRWHSRSSTRSVFTAARRS